MGLPHLKAHLKATGLLHKLHKATDHHRRRAIRTSDILCLSCASAKLEAGRKVFRAIRLLKEGRHHSQAMEAMARHHPNHRERTVDTNRYHTYRIRKE